MALRYVLRQPARLLLYIILDLIVSWDEGIISIGVRMTRNRMVPFSTPCFSILAFILWIAWPTKPSQFADLHPPSPTGRPSHHTNPCQSDHTPRSTCDLDRGSSSSSSCHTPRKVRWAGSLACMAGFRSTTTPSDPLVLALARLLSTDTHA